MKLIKKGKKQEYFITGDDVVITKSLKHAGEDVDDAIVDIDNTLDKHQDEIDRLKSNVKYIYSYGGVGGSGHGGSGGGGGQTGTPSLFVSLNGRQIQAGSDNIIVLNSPGQYSLEASVLNSGGETYRMDVTYGVSRPLKFTFNEDNRWQISPTLLTLNENGTIIIQFYTSEYRPISEISQTYIVNPHSYNVRFMYEYDNGSGQIQKNEFNPKEYFIGGYSQTNPFIDISYSISLPAVSNIFVKYDIGDTDETDNNISYDSINDIHAGHGTISCGSNTSIVNNHIKIYLDKLIRKGIKFTDESNNGTYIVSTSLTYTVNGSEQIQETSWEITLIPNSLYIHVTSPQNIMYDTLEDLEEARRNGKNGLPAKYINTGAYASFLCKVFEGPMITAPKYYVVDFNTYDFVDSNSDSDDEPDTYELSYSDSNTNVKEQETTSTPFSVAFQRGGIKKLEFKTIGKKTSNHENEKPTIKYIYVNEPEHDVKNWYPADLEQTNFYFRANIGTNINDDRFRNLQPLEIGERDRQVVLSNQLWSSIDASKDTTILSFGIQYSAVNKDGSKILETYAEVDGNDLPDIRLYSDKLFDITNSEDSTKKILIPSENNFNKSINNQYHLVQIVRYKIGTENGSNKWASYLYIDGRLESNKSTLDDGVLRVGKIVFNNVNVVYNLIDIQYVRLFNPSLPDTKNTLDGLIYQYYLAYKDIMHAGTVSKAEKTILDNLHNMKFDGTNVIVNYDFVRTVSPDMPIPTMLMSYTDDGTVTDRQNFIRDLFRGYGVGQTDLFGEKPITLQWCDGIKTGKDITDAIIPRIVDGNDVYTGQWMLALQGTSTMTNRIKNFSLIVSTTNSTGTKQILVSPNYDKDDSTTFLPEQIWTLKADIADSAHANNTSVGKFVNRACTQFITSIDLGDKDLSSEIKGYIKNTLEGFPVLMYFKVGDDIYYLGVYNFNMGRDSHYNLGYNTVDDITDMYNRIQDSEDETPFKYSVGYGEKPATIAIGEIQDNHEEFDFHQFDDTVLFGTGSMFGPDKKITGKSKDDVSNAKGTLRNFVRSVAKAGAYCFATIGKIPVSSKADDSNDCINRYGIEPYVENNETKYREFVPDLSWQFSVEGSTKRWYNPDDPNLSPERKADVFKFDDIKTDIDYLLQCISPQDKNDHEHDYYLDFTSVAEYYTICMAFGLVDSVLKNMNIKSWDGKRCYIAFYDMDCGFGENNLGQEDVSYLAATDYWYSPTTNGYVETVKIHYDYWDDTIGKGFDYTSSYLFAIAKYAQAIINRFDGTTLYNFPQQFWVNLRSVGGELESADRFMEKYFSSGIGQIPTYLASLNYQVKYLYYGAKMDQNGNETAVSSFLANEVAFNGSRIEKVRNWLNKRLHFLDFMFNIQGVGIELGGGYAMPLADDTSRGNLVLNPDVVILTDAFTDDISQPGARVKSQSQPVDVYAPVNTPFIIKRGSNDPAMYLLSAGTGVPNSIRVTVSKSERIRFLGSQEFTDLSMVDPFLTTFDKIVSNNLESVVYGGMDIPSSNTELKIISTSVKRIILNIPSYRGSLGIDTSETLNGQALMEIDVSGSGIVGSWTSLKNLKILNISSVNSEQGSITVADCPIEGGENCKISGKDAEHPTTLKSLTMSGVSGTFNLKNTHIETIIFTGLKNKESNFEINGDTLLNELRLTGFKNVVVKGCPNLRKVYIEDNPDSSIKCEKIIIDIPLNYTNPNGREQYQIEEFNGVVENGVFDFTGYSQLKTLGLSGCQTVKTIKIPNHIVSIETFRDDKNLEFVDTIGPQSCIELIHDSTFLNCPRYGMMQSWATDDDIVSDVTNINTLTSKIYNCNKRTKMRISTDCKTLARTFDKIDSSITSEYTASKNKYYTNSYGQKVYNRAIRIQDATWFINEVVAGQPLDDAYINHIGEGEDIIHDTYSVTDFGENVCGEIKSLQGCFNMQKGIIYTGIGNDDVPNLSAYKKLTDISAMYYNTGISFISSELLSLPNELNNNKNLTVNWSEFVKTGDLNVSENAFENISYRITSLTSMQLTIYDKTDYSKKLVTSEDNRFNIVDLLCPQKDEHNEWMLFERIEAFNSFAIDPTQWVDYTDLFNWCPNVTTLTGFLFTNLSRAKIDGMLKPCEHLSIISESFQHTGDPETDLNEIDLYDFFNWGDEPGKDNLYGIEKLFEINNDTNEDPTPGFAIKKRIDQDKFELIMESLHNYTNIQKLSNIFSYCTIYNFDPTYEIKLEEDMDNVKNVDSLFYHCKSDSDEPLKIRRSFFEHLKGVTSVIKTFSGVNFDNMLSYDFFCKRIPITEQVYVKINPSDSLTAQPNATLNTIGYRASTINNMFGCFWNAKFMNCNPWFDPEDSVNNDLIPDEETITINSTGQPYNGDTYYRKPGGLPVEYKVSKHNIYTDTLNNFNNYVDSVRINYGQSGVDYGSVISNHNIEADISVYNPNYGGILPYEVNGVGLYPTYCCIPPDIFYGCSNNCVLTKCFSNTNIVGVLPQHLLEKCNYRSKYINMFENVNMLPNIMYHYDRQCSQDYIDSLVDPNDPTVNAQRITNYTTKRQEYITLITQKDTSGEYKIPVDESGVSGTYTLLGNTPTSEDSSDAIVLFRNSDGELRRRRVIDNDALVGDAKLNGDYSKSQFVYVPQGYTSNENLDSAFTFRYNLPSQVGLNYGSLLREYDIDWPAGTYDTSHSPDLRPEKWPHYIQYFFMTDESIKWTNLYYMRSPFISDSQDMDFPKREGRQRVLMPQNDDQTKNCWFTDKMTFDRGNWHQKTNGVMNIFINLCGQRNSTTGIMYDNGCVLSTPLNRQNNPQIGSFVTGSLVAFLNGRVFDDGFDGGIITSQYAGSGVIQYVFSRNIILPLINSILNNNPSTAPKILLDQTVDRSLYYEYNFPNTQSLNNYCAIWGLDRNNNFGPVSYKYRVQQ